MTARTVPAALVGIDVVDVDRVGAAVDGLHGVFMRRVFAAGERAAIGADVDSVAVGFAVKECLIKAIGGRHEPFSWHDLETDLRMPAPLEPTGHRLVERLLATAALPFVRAVGPALVLAAPCGLVAGAGRAALLRLTGGERAAGAELTGMAMWGWTGRRVTAVAVVMLDPSEVDIGRLHAVTG